MRKQLTVLLAGAVTAVTVQAADGYPDSKAVSQQDMYFDTKVEDPYRWLENTATGEVKDWVTVQNAHALPRLKQLPGWQKINDRLTKLWRYERYGVPYKKGDSYYYGYNSGDWDQNIFYRAGDLAREGKPILDPRSLSEDGTIAAKRLTVSPRGRFLAFGTSDGGTTGPTTIFAICAPAKTSRICSPVSSSAVPVGQPMNPAFTTAATRSTKRAVPMTANR